MKSKLKTALVKQWIKDFEEVEKATGIPIKRDAMKRAIKERLRKIDIVLKEGLDIGGIKEYIIPVVLARITKGTWKGQIWFYNEKYGFYPILSNIQRITIGGIIKTRQ